MLLTLLQAQATPSQDLSFSAAGVIWGSGVAVFEPGAGELTFFSGRIRWGVGSGSLNSVNDLIFVSARLRLTAGDSVLTEPMVLTFSAAGLSCEVGRVKLRLPTEAYPLFGTSLLRSNLYGTG